MLDKLVGKLPIISIGIVVMLVTLTLLLVARDRFRNPLEDTDTTNSSSSSDTSSGGSGSTSSALVSGTAATYNYAGVTPADTVALFNESNAPVIINIDHRQWTKLKWSPEGGFLAVLGVTNDGIGTLDLFVYSIATENWRRATFYGAGSEGIDNFEWVDETLLVYTQGRAGNRWIHQYDYENQEISKLVQVDGDLAFIQPTASSSQKLRFVISKLVSAPTAANDKIFTVIDSGGAVLTTFRSSNISDLFTITRVVAGSTVDEYYIGGTNNQGNFAYVSWDFNDPVFRLERITQSRGVPAGSTSGSSSSQGSAVSTTVGMEVLCVAVGADVYVRPVITTTSQLLSIGRWSSSDGGYQELGLLAQSGTISLLTERVYCENNAILVPVTDQEDNTVAWYEVTLSGTENLNAEGYRYVSLKPISATQ